jgi:hypothetical protein
VDEMYGVIILNINEHQQLKRKEVQGYADHAILLPSRRE